MSKLPPSVEAQSKRSEELIENLSKPVNEVQEEAQELQPPEEISPPVEFPHEEPQRSELPQDSQITSLAEELKKEKQRNDSLQGITEVNKTYIAEQKEQIKRLEAELEAMKTATPQEPINYAADVFTEEDIENLGEEYVEAMQRTTNIAVQKALAEQRNELEKIYKVQEQTQEQALWSSVIGLLGTDKKSFNELDTSPDFNQWLEQPDGMSGYTLGESLSHAIGANNVERVAGFYKTFMDKHQKVAPLRKPITTQPGQVAQTQIEPGNNRRYSKSKYLETVSKWTSGRLRNWTQAQFDKYCEEIDRAHIEGRLDP